MSAPSTAAKNKSAVNHLENLKRISNLLENGRCLNEESIPAKVAIIDTGINPSHPHIGNFYGYENFPKSAIGKNEGTSHSSNMVHLFHMVAPYAKVYVARILDGEPWSSKSSISAAKKVDIISISFGLRDEPAEILKAIEDTHHTLMFAAASNFGSNEEPSIRFPARMKHRVICINSADGNGNPSGGNSPPDTSRDNFTVLGEDVPLGKESISGLERRTTCGNGASVATAIAAGVAALVFCFAR